MLSNRDPIAFRLVGYRASIYAVMLHNATILGFGRGRVMPTVESNAFHAPTWIARYQRFGCTPSAADNKRLEEMHRELKRRFKMTSNSFSSPREVLATLTQEHLLMEEENFKHDRATVAALRVWIGEVSETRCA